MIFLVKFEFDALQQIWQRVIYELELCGCSRIRIQQLQVLSYKGHLAQCDDFL